MQPDAKHMPEVLCCWKGPIKSGTTFFWTLPTFTVLSAPDAGADADSTACHGMHTPTCMHAEV